MVNFDFKKIAEKIADELVGTCGTLNSTLEANNLSNLDDDLDFTTALDTLIFECTTCAWWCLIEEEHSSDYNLSELTCLECCEEL